MPDDAGRVLVQDTGDRFNLPGGSPELIDADLAATVVLEAMEESQVTVAAAQRRGVPTPVSAYLTYYAEDYRGGRWR